MQVIETVEIKLRPGQAVKITSDSFYGTGEVLSVVVFGDGAVDVILPKYGFLEQGSNTRVFHVGNDG